MKLQPVGGQAQPLSTRRLTDMVTYLGRQRRLALLRIAFPSV